MANLQQLRNKFFSLIAEDNTGHFDDADANGLLNEGQEFLAVFIEYPRDLFSVTAQEGIGSYANPADNLLIRTAYFGNQAVAGDIRPLKIVSEETLREIYPSWLDGSTSNRSDRPEYLIQLDRQTIHIVPRPNATGAGKKIWINYNYVPAAMVSDSDEPDLPAPYHNLIVLYAVHLAYYTLQKPELSALAYKDMMEKVTRLRSAVTKEAKEIQGFAWGTSEGLNDNTYGGIEF